MNNNTPQKPLEPWLQALKKKVADAPQKESLPFDFEAEWSKLEASLPKASTPLAAHKGARLLRFKKWSGVAATVALLQQGAKILRYKGYGTAAAATLVIGIAGLTWVMLKKPNTHNCTERNCRAFSSFSSRNEGRSLLLSSIPSTLSCSKKRDSRTALCRDTPSSNSKQGVHTPRRGSPNRKGS